MVFTANLFISSLSAQQRSELAQQKFIAHQEAEPLNFLLQAVKDGEQMPPGKLQCYNLRSGITSLQLLCPSTTVAVT